jgi:hypothetical protein
MAHYLQTKRRFNFTPVGAGSFTGFEIMSVCLFIRRTSVTRPCKPTNNKQGDLTRRCFMWLMRSRAHVDFTLKGGLSVHEQSTINGHLYWSVNPPLRKILLSMVLMTNQFIKATF